MISAKVSLSLLYLSSFIFTFISSGMILIQTSHWDTSILKWRGEMASFIGKIKTLPADSLTSHWPFKVSSTNPCEGPEIPRVGLDCPSSAVEKTWESSQRIACNETGRNGGLGIPCREKHHKQQQRVRNVWYENKNMNVNKIQKIQ